MVAGCSSPGSVTGNPPVNSTILPPSQGGGDLACTKEAKLCPDGSAVGRVLPGCEFAPCPTQKQSTSMPAPLNGGIKSNISLPPSQGSSGIVCTQEVKLCPNGSYVGRTLPNCEFKSCPR